MTNQLRSAVIGVVVSITLAGSLQSQVFNGGIPAGFTCVGTCGVSGPDGVVPLAPAGGTQFGYITTFGGPIFNPLGVDPNTTNGSTLTSSPFNATAGQLLSFRFDYVTSDGGPFDDYAYVRLIGNGSSTILFTARTIPQGNTVPGQSLPGLEPGVTLLPSSTPVIAGAPNFTPLGAPYNNTCYDAGCGYTGWIRAAYGIPIAGTYQLEFGVFNLLDELWDSSLAIDYALGPGQTPEIPENENENEHGGNTVTPEPSTWMLLGTGLFAIAAIRRRRTSTLG